MRSAVERCVSRARWTGPPGAARSRQDPREPPTARPLDPSARPPAGAHTAGRRHGPGRRTVHPADDPCARTPPRPSGTTTSSCSLASPARSPPCRNPTGATPACARRHDHRAGPPQHAREPGAPRERPARPGVGRDQPQRVLGVCQEQTDTRVGPDGARDVTQETADALVAHRTRAGCAAGRQLGRRHRHRADDAPRGPSR